MFGEYAYQSVGYTELTGFFDECTHIVSAITIICEFGTTNAEAQIPRRAIEGQRVALRPPFYVMSGDNRHNRAPNYAWGGWVHDMTPSFYWGSYYMPAEEVVLRATWTFIPPPSGD
jgi:hypothetical protein